MGNAFVLQYYHILEQSPEHVYRFYQDNSKFGRPEDNGMMKTVTTMDVSSFCNLTFFLSLHLRCMFMYDHNVINVSYIEPGSLCRIFKCCVILIDY